MKHHLNTLFVTTKNAYLAKDGQAVVVRIERKPRLRVPLHNLGGIVCLGRIGFSPALVAACGQTGVAISLLTEHGRFLARVSGFTSGNVLLRREQYRAADAIDRSTQIARAMLIGKLANARSVVQRAMRDHPKIDRTSLTSVSNSIMQSIDALCTATSLDAMRGIEGEAANTYFACFSELITAQNDQFTMNGRSRRPPLDRVNALLSFLYAMLAHDARSACEAAGLDPAVGFLHRDRPGRPSLALDLMEEFRPLLADRVALSLINRQQVKPDGFRFAESGAVVMDEQTRKTVITAYQLRKQETIKHPFINETTTVGLLIHLQARLLARLLRGELDEYPPFIWK